MNVQFIKFLQIFVTIFFLVRISCCFTIQKYPSTVVRVSSQPRQFSILHTTRQQEQLSTTETAKKNKNKNKNGFNYRNLYNISDSFESMEKLTNRLIACGVDNFFFMHDDDTTYQLAPVLREDTGKSVLERVSRNELRKVDIMHVKTLVWKGTFLRNSTNIDTNNNNPNINQDEKRDEQLHNNVDSFYFVTALRMEDKVDMKKLRMIVKEDYLRKKRNAGGTLILQLAELDEAEKITGFSSGSMPPGWHSVPLKLYIDDFIVESFNRTKEVGMKESASSVGGEISSDGIGDNGHHWSKIMLSVGSGSSNYSLHVSLLDTIASSVYLEDRVSVCQLLGLDAEITLNAKSHGRYVTPFTRTRAEERNKDRQKKFKLNAKKESKLSVDCRGDETIDSDLNKPLNITRRLLHVTSKKKGKAEEVKRMIDILGDDFPSFMRVDAGTDDERYASEYNKNAVHYAAWKGDAETVTLLLNECKKYEDELGDAVNTISTGEGCYGKTPIFYAITQCRDDMVLHLLALGANLLVVNNKGQSPTSLAVNKLKPETCQFMYQIEEAQLKAGGEFSNYRHSHSDGRSYGDLDPRFLEFGDINMDVDIQAEFDQFQEFVATECEEQKEQMLEKNPFLQHTIPEQCLPRSVRVSTPALRQAIRNIDQEDKKREQAGDKNEATELSILRSVRVTTPIWRQEAWLKKQSDLKKNHPDTQENNGPKKEEVSKKASLTIPKNIVQLQDGKEIDMDLLETLNLQDVLTSTSHGEQKTYELVDDDVGILTLQFAIDEILTRLEDTDASNMNDELISETSWGLDCEWRPSKMSGEANPVATLQLSSSSRSFVIDVQTLCQGGVDDFNTDMTVTELALSNTLSRLFSSNKVRIIGFGIAQDLSKLAASFPHMSCFQEFHAVLDLQQLNRLVYPFTSKNFMSSLQKATSILLRKRMDKTEQCSEWNVRPLRESQLEYASLDATILPLLLSKMVQENPNGFFLRKNIGIQTSYRYTFLQDDGGCSYRIEMGSMKKSMDLKFARQIWPSFKKNVPILPEKGAPYEVAVQSPATNQGKTKKSRPSRVKKNAIALTELSIDIERLPLIGKEVGYTKDSCIDHSISEEVMKSLPEDSYLRYNRRGGILEIGNCWMLFVNFGVGKIHAKYRNEFVQGGKMVTFTINPSRYEDGDLLQNLLITDESSMSRKGVLLFMRGSSKEQFICCGKVSCHSHRQNEDNDLVHLVLELTQFDELKVNTEESSELSNYMRVVSENSLEH